MDENLSEKRQVNKVLWLTDTYGDHNGVSMVLQSIHSEIVLRNLPVDIMVCSNDLKSDKHLIVLKPLSEFNIPLYRQQPMRIPNYLTIQRIFNKRKYDSVICSTEGPMGFAALYLKKMYSVKTFFYLHTDWIMFARQVMGIEDTGIRRLQRAMRVYYNQFDCIFVLNSDQQKWLTGGFMRFKPERVLLTAHWAEDIFTERRISLREPGFVAKREPVILFAGRISREKGVFELPSIFKKVRETIPGLKMLVAGTGPAENELKAVFPEAEYTGWIDHLELPAIYASADLLLLPSKFDTFSCVVLEALSCGLPVIAYNTKGPKDIIQDSKNGFLVDTNEEMTDRILEYFSNSSVHEAFRTSALLRADDYTAGNILQKLLEDIGIPTFKHSDGTETT